MIGHFHIVGYSHIEGRIWGVYHRVQGKRVQNLYVPHICVCIGRILKRYQKT